MVDFNEQLLPKHKWNLDAQVLEQNIRSFGHYTLVNPEDGHLTSYGSSALPTILKLQLVANDRKLGLQLCMDLMAEAGLTLDGDDCEPTYTKR